MGEKSSFVEPYKPSPLHAIYRWTDSLPGPYWLFSILFLVGTGLINVIVGWIANVPKFREEYWSYAFTGFFFAYYFFASDFLLRRAKKTILEFLPKLDVDENKKRLILFEFTHLPARPSIVLYILGAILGLVLAIVTLPEAAEMNPSDPILEITVYGLSMGMIFVTLYLVLRISFLLNRLFREKVNINIFEPASLYAIARFSAWCFIAVAILTYAEYLLIPTFVGITWVFLSITLVHWVFALIVFWVPLQGANRHLVSEKKRLLQEVNLRISTNFDLLHSKSDKQDYQNVADIRELIASLQIEQKSIESISTWPWRAGALTGLVTAVVLPLAGSVLIDFVSKFIKIYFG